MIIGYDKEDFQEFGVKNPVNIVLPKKTSSVLVTGCSGSGKSLSIRLYIWQVLKSRESYVCISDYKGGEEYESFEGSPSYASGEDAFQMIDAYYEFFEAIRKNRIRLQQHYMLVIEEWFGLLTYAENRSKKQKAELMAKVGEILAVGRGLNIGIMLCVQRADASHFNAGTRDQFQAVICFGRCSTEQFRMLGFHAELESNPSTNYKAGEALVLIDGQDSVREVIVPFIENEDVLCKQVRHYLDKQPTIAELIQAVAEGESRISSV